ncbi:putative amino acid permease [Filobasidium floriforme]|uniref:putative amino acid permease n=1 Tax=Filobasidium floriforme TaxID=5210 RepID=UPI001E8D3B57|nr:putative amino acid permease [Filobasidium floriforme]KAH8089362.1 putative amino acid permease [Filobasidium floriforme]
METPRSYQSDADIDQDVEKKVPYDGDIVYPSATTDSDHAPVMRRHLKSRHIAFIGLGGGIGVGLFVGVGKGLSVAGPLGLFLAFTIMGAIMWGVLQGAAEMAAVIPTAGGFPHFAARFIDPALGFALGWNYAVGYALSVASELSACAIIISYWSDLNAAIWIAILCIPFLVLNMLGVKFYGESEVITASLKVITLVGLIILGLVIDLGGAPSGDRIGFRYWQNPGAMRELPGVGGGAKARFLAFFSAFISAAYSYTGTETVILAAGEASNPSKQIPRAAKRVMYRIIIFYVLGVLIIGMIVPFNEPRLLGGSDNAASSPWVIAIEKAGIKVLPHIINAVILTSAWSAGNTYVFTSSRTLYGLALQGHAPKFFTWISKQGVPWTCVLAVWLVSLLSFLSAGSGGAAAAFGWLQNLTALAALNAWATIAYAAARMSQAFKKQGISRDTIPFRAPLSPWVQYFSSFFCSVIILFSGFSVFLNGNWSTSDFFANYISLFLYIAPYIGYKIIKKTKYVRSADADLFSGRLRPEEEFEEKPSTSVVGRVFDRLF